MLQLLGFMSRRIVNVNVTVWRGQALLAGLEASTMHLAGLYSANKDMLLRLETARAAAASAAAATTQLAADIVQVNENEKRPFVTDHTG